MELIDLIVSVVTAAILLAGAVAFGKQKGRTEAEDDMQDADFESANDAKERIDENRAKRVGADPIDRLHKSGRLRD